MSHGLKVDKNGSNYPYVQNCNQMTCLSASVVTEERDSDSDRKKETVLARRKETVLARRMQTVTKLGGGKRGVLPRPQTESVNILLLMYVLPRHLPETLNLKTYRREIQC